MRHKNKGASDADQWLHICASRGDCMLILVLYYSEFEVREKPNLSTWMQAGLDHIMLQYLNIDGIRTIGSVLGQSIALDYYVRQVRVILDYKFTCEVSDSFSCSET